MIRTILSKCLEELQKEKSDLSYIRGMIEVLLASQSKETYGMGYLDGSSATLENVISVLPIIQKSGPVSTLTDEASILDAKARAAVEDIKKLGGIELA